MLANLLILIVLTALVIYIFYYQKYSVPLFITVFSLILWQGISIAYLETGTYSIELYTNTYKTGATTRYAISFVSLILGYYLGFNMFFKKYYNSNPDNNIFKKENINIYYTVFLIVISFFVIFCLYKIPQDFPESKKIFIEIIQKEPIIFIFFKYFPLIGFGLGFIFMISQLKVVYLMAYLNTLAIIFVLYRFGNKFSSIIDFIYPFLIPIMISLLKEFEFKNKNLTKIVLTSFLLIYSFSIMTIGFTKYHNIHLKDKKTLEINPLQELSSIENIKTRLKKIDYFKTRIFILQGGVFWAIDNNIFINKHIPQKIESIKQIKKIKHSNPSAVYLMKKIIGEEKTKYVLDRYSLYSGISPAIFYEIFGKKGPIIAFFILGTFLGITGAYLTSKILKRQFFLSIISFTVFIPIYNVILTGEFLNISTDIVILKILIIIIIEKKVKNKFLFLKT